MAYASIFFFFFVFQVSWTTQELLFSAITSIDEQAYNFCQLITN